MSDALATLAAMKEAGADRVDPVRFHFLEALAQRAQAQPPSVAYALERKLSALLTEYQSRCQQAQKAAKTAAKKSARKAAQASPLSALLDHISASTLASDTEAAIARPAEAAPRVAGEAASSTTSPPPELKALRYFRDDWSKLSTDQLIHQSLASAPENAGPLNSHMLVLKAIELMRDAAPAYLANFIGYVDTLLWLEQALAGLPAKKPARGAEGERKRKTSRGKAS